MLYIQNIAFVLECGVLIAGCNDNFEHMQRSVAQDEYLIGVYDKLIYRFAVIITSKETLNTFNNQYKLGMLTGRKFYSIPKKDALMTSLSVKMEIE
jgi:hypothetical protein